MWILLHSTLTVFKKWATTPAPREDIRLRVPFRGTTTIVYCPKNIPPFLYWKAYQMTANGNNQTLHLCWQFKRIQKIIHQENYK